MIKVTELEIGDKIKFNSTEVFVKEIGRTKIMLSKKTTGRGMFSLPVYSHKFDDLMNRVEVVYG